MRLISFDIGIKNFCYCIIDYTNDNFNICHWKILNLINNEDKCFSDNCNQTIQYKIKMLYKDFFSCKKHLDTRNHYIEKNFKSYNLNWINSDDKCDICNLTNNISFNSIDNKKLCTKHLNQYKKKIINCCNKSSFLKIKKFDCELLRLNLLRILDNNKIELLTNIDYVLIENQPSMKNPIMKGIADTLYTWYLIRGIIDSNINQAEIKKIKLIAPTNKFKKNDIETVDNLTESKKYSNNKKKSIELCIDILKQKNLENWISYLNNYLKKDDLADSFLQGYYFIKT